MMQEINLFFWRKTKFSFPADSFRLS